MYVVVFFDFEENKTGISKKQIDGDDGIINGFCAVYRIKQITLVVCVYLYLFYSPIALIFFLCGTFFSLFVFFAYVLSKSTILINKYIWRKTKDPTCVRLAIDWKFSMLDAKQSPCELNYENNVLSTIVSTAISGSFARKNSINKQRFKKTLVSGRRRKKSSTLTKRD